MRAKGGLKVLLYLKDNDERRAVVEALSVGIRRRGDQAEIRPESDFKRANFRGYDVVISGRMATSRRMMERCQETKLPFIYFGYGYTYYRDKPDARHYRFSVNGYHPLSYFQSTARPSDRWQKLGIEIKPLRADGQDIVFAGCSAKFANLFALDAAGYAAETIAQIRRHTDLNILYRPKPSEKEILPIPGSILSHDGRPIAQDLANAHALVTFSSNAAVDAVLEGVPIFVLGPGIARPVSNTDLLKIKEPWFPSENERLQWCYDLAYCQWQLNEMADGTAWEYLRGNLQANV